MGKTGDELFVGVDSGTQSTKVVVVDGEDGQVLASAAAPHELIPGLPPGHAEQHPQEWFDAMGMAMEEALGSDSVDAAKVRAIGVSGQQHGFVALDGAGEVIRPAKLWCDTSTAAQCDRIIEQVGGLAHYVELTGNGLPPGFTASKIAWLKENEPDNFGRLATVLLPHDYLNYRLTGELRMEYGDASGTALLDIRSRKWCAEVIEAIDGRLAGMLPEMITPGEPCGHLKPELASRWGMGDGVVVSAGGGDNMMSAIGTGNVTEGVVTVSLGTSGTIFAYSPSPVSDPRGEVAGFCDSTGGWLPLVCTMNVTVATELTKSLLGMETADLDPAVERVSPGADGLLLIPYFEGERTPNVPSGTGVWFGASRRTHTPAHFARAAMEGATLGLKYGLDRMVELGLSVSQARLTGGGANSAAWRRIAAEVFGAAVVCLEQSESAAFGAAMQGAWCRRRMESARYSVGELADTWVKTDELTHTAPDAAYHAYYGRLAGLHNQVSDALRESFEAHRAIVTGSQDQ